MILKLPKNTCPDIDRCIEWINALTEEAKEGDSDHATKLQACIIDTLEDLRSANAALRDAAIDMEDELNKTEERMDKEIEELKDEIKELEYVIRHMPKEGIEC